MLRQYCAYAKQKDRCKIGSPRGFFLFYKSNFTTDMPPKYTQNKIFREFFGKNGVDIVQKNPIKKH